MIVATPQPDVESMRARLNEAQGTIATLKHRIEQAEKRREHDAAEARDWFERCNQTYDVVSPLAKFHDKWLHIGDKCRTIGKIATFALPVAMMASVGLGHPPLATVALLGDLAVIGATLFAVRKSQAVTEREGPKVDRLVDEWKYLKERMDRANASAEATKREIGRLESDLRKEQGDVQVIEMALAMPVTPVTTATVVKEDDAIVIGSLRIPRRVTN